MRELGSGKREVGVADGSLVLSRRRGGGGGIRESVGMSLESHFRGQSPFARKTRKISSVPPKSITRTGSAQLENRPACATVHGHSRERDSWRVSCPKTLSQLATLLEAGDRGQFCAETSDQTATASHPTLQTRMRARERIPRHSAISRLAEAN